MKREPGVLRPQAAERARACLRRLSREAKNLLFFTASGEMGERALRECGLNCEIVHTAPLKSPAPRIQKPPARPSWKNGVDLILFCGGDGTARDVASLAGQVPILGIPAGVKMHSGVFAISPEAAAELALGFIRGELRAQRDGDRGCRRGALPSRRAADQALCHSQNALPTCAGAGEKEDL